MTARVRRDIGSLRASGSSRRGSRTALRDAGGSSPSHRHADDRPVRQHVELVAAASLTLRVVDVQGLVAEEPGEGDAVPDREIEIIAGDRLPGELAADAEAANVAADEKLLAGRDREGQAEPRDLVGGAGLGDRHLVLEVARGGDAGDDVRRHAARPDAAAGDRELLPDAIAEEGDRAVPRLEMGHHGEELVPLAERVVNDVEEGLVDLHGPAPDGLAASDRGKPSVRRELEGPGWGRDFDEDRRRRGDWRIGTERRARGEKPEGNRCGEP